MYFLALSVLSLAIAVLPWKISLLGRVLGLLSAAWCWVYGSAVLAGRAPLGVGALGNFVGLDPSPWSGEGVTAGLGFLLALLAATTYRKQASRLSFGTLKLRPPPWLMLSVLAFAWLSAIYIAATLGLENIFAYSGYGSIKALNEIYDGNVVGRLIATGFRLTTMLLIVISIHAWANGSKRYVFLALPAIALAFAIGLAEASRIISVYFGLAAIGFLLVGKRFGALIMSALAFLGVAYALEARGNPALGLTYLPQYVAAALQNEAILESVLTNVSSGLLVTSASIKIAIPDAYGLDFKLLSFMPTIDAIDGFQASKAIFEQRVLGHIPFNGFAEAWLFGPQYLVGFWAVLALSVLAVNSSMRYGVFPFLLLLCVFCLGWVLISQYPIRNGLRYFYLVLAMRAALPLVHGWLQRRTARAYDDPGLGWRP
jgi:hypothetical protein